MTFFEKKFLLHIITSRQNFLLLPKLHIFSRSEKSWGDKEKALHRTTTNNDERRTNERTTNYIDDDNSPPGLS